jgi:hypothetical protein
VLGLYKTMASMLNVLNQASADKKKTGKKKLLYSSFYLSFEVKNIGIKNKTKGIRHIIRITIECNPWNPNRLNSVTILKRKKHEKNKRTLFLIWLSNNFFVWIRGTITMNPMIRILI